MKALILLAALLTPATVSANVFTMTCDPAIAPAPSNWFGGPWTSQLKLRVDTDAKTIELLDQNNVTLAATLQAARVAGGGNFQVDVTIDERVINWGIARMWGISGYLDRKSGQLDVLWTNPRGSGADTLIRQFHGTCH
jgi:hypothetical protein